MTPTVAAPLRPRVSVHLDATLRRRLDEEFGPGMEAAVDAMDDLDPLRAFRAQTYYVAATDRRPPAPTITPPDPAPGCIVPALVVLTAAMVPLVLYGLDDLGPRAIDFLNGLIG